MVRRPRRRVRYTTVLASARLKCRFLFSLLRDLQRFRHDMKRTTLGYSRRSRACRSNRESVSGGGGPRSSSARGYPRVRALQLSTLSNTSASRGPSPTASRQMSKRTRWGRRGALRPPATIGRSSRLKSNGKRVRFNAHVPSNAPDSSPQGAGARGARLARSRKNLYPQRFLVPSADIDTVGVASSILAPRTIEKP